VHGTGELKEPGDVLDCGNSGTTMRLLSGILAGQAFLSVLTGDASLRSRPMRRIAEPLRLMGAHVDGRDGGERAPLVIRGGRLKGLECYHMPVASAQVKSCALLAGLFASGTTTIVEPAPSRDHTERMLPLFGAATCVENGHVSVAGGQTLHGTAVDVPGDVSSAAFWLVLGSMLPQFEVTVLGIGLNPSRTGVLDVLRRMGCRLDVHQTRLDPEPLADVRVTGDRLSGVEISPRDVPSLQDELPVLAVAAAMAEGVTVVTGASELRHKESDRISATVENLRAMGASVEERPDGFIIDGTGRLRGASIRTRGDHRIAMAFAIAGLVADGETVLDDVECIDISYPGFMDVVNRISSGGDVLHG
jgi:3-phosphoshikimate 1-carboxyvinyltransferase